MGINHFDAPGEAGGDAAPDPGFHPNNKGEKRRGRAQFTG